MTTDLHTLDRPALLDLRDEAAIANDRVAIRAIDEALQAAAIPLEDRKHAAIVLHTDAPQETAMWHAAGLVRAGREQWTIVDGSSDRFAFRRLTRDIESGEVTVDVIIVPRDDRQVRVFAEAHGIQYVVLHEGQ